MIAPVKLRCRLIHLQGQHEGQLRLAHPPFTSSSAQETLSFRPLLVAACVVFQGRKHITQKWPRGVEIRVSNYGKGLNPPLVSEEILQGSNTRDTRYGAQVHTKKFMLATNSPLMLRNQRVNGC